MKKILILAIITVFSVVGILPAASANAATPYCGITWGSLSKSANPYSTKQLIDVRTGRHSCYDRIVLQMNGTAAGYDVRYVDNVFVDGSGELIPLNGGAKLQIILKAPAYDPYTGMPTYSPIIDYANPAKHLTLPGVNLTGYTTFRDARFAGTFEGQTTIGLGVRAHLPFRVFKLDNRVVIDVAHKW